MRYTPPVRLVMISEYRPPLVFAVGSLKRKRDPTFLKLPGGSVGLNRVPFTFDSLIETGSVSGSIGVFGTTARCSANESSALGRKMMMPAGRCRRALRKMSGVTVGVAVGVAVGVGEPGVCVPMM